MDHIDLQDLANKIGNVVKWPVFNREMKAFMPQGILMIMKPINFDSVPDDVWKELEYEIARAELEYADNYRAFRLNDKLHYEDFRSADRRGCCGRAEWRIKVNGVTWVVACNYGH